MKYVFIIALLFLLVRPSFGQNVKNFIDSLEQTIASIKEELVEIKKDYYVIQAAGVAGNIGIYVGTGGVVMVDNQWSALAPRIKELIKTITDKPVRYVINTHFHFDHVDGNKFFGKEAIPIIAHINLRNRLAGDQIISGGFGLQKAFPVEALPSLTFTDSIVLYDTNEIIRVIHRPHAHTDGDAIVHFKNADIYHAGDIFVTYGLPVIDENNGGDIYATIQTIDYLLSVSNSGTRFIPGHGPVCTVKELSDYRNLLVDIRDKVVQLVKKRIPLEKIINEVSINKGIGGVDRAMFISHVYRMAVKHKQ